jgi:hypothetical protein
MMRTMGNIVDTGRVALLFVDTGRPWRMRIHATATVSTDPTDTSGRPGAEAIVIVTPTRIFPNCGRYIHRSEVISEFVPDERGEAPLPAWKRYDAFRPVLPVRDQQRLAAEE